MQPEPSLGNVQSQVIAEIIAAAVEQAFSRTLDSPLKTRVVNMPQVQAIGGTVSVSNINQLSELILKLITAVYETEVQDKEVQRVEIVNEPKELEFPDVQKVEVTNQVTIPSEITTKLPKEFLLSIEELIKKIESKELSTSVNVDAPDMRPVADQIGILSSGIDGMLSKLIDIEGKTGLDTSSGIIDALEAVKESIFGIIIPSPKPFPTDSNQNIKVAEQNKLVKVPYDSVYGTYPNTVTEVYSYKRAGNTVATVTVVYSDASKSLFSSVVLS